MSIRRTTRTARLLTTAALAAVLLTVAAGPAAARGVDGDPNLAPGGGDGDPVVGLLDTGARHPGQREPDRSDTPRFTARHFGISQAFGGDIHGPGGHAPDSDTTPDGFKFGSGCQFQCITSGVAYARMTGAELFVTTDTPAKIRIQVWGNGYFDFVESEPGQTSFNALFDDLDGGTTYQAAAYAVDSAGKQSIAHGHITTLDRHVEIKVPIVALDSTHWANGDPTAITIWANGKHRTLFNDPERVGHFLIPGTAVYAPSTTPTLAKVDQALDLQVGVMEYRSGHNESICEGVGWQNMEPHAAVSNCFAQSFARPTTSNHLIDLDARPPWATSWTEHTIMTTLEVDAPGPTNLVFSVPVTLEVTYQ